MTHVALIDTIWQHIDRHLTASAPSDGCIYDVKCWVLSNVSEPVLGVLYKLALTTHKPNSALTQEDMDDLVAGVDFKELSKTTPPIGITPDKLDTHK